MVEKTTFDDLVKLMQGNKIHRCPKCGGSGTIIKRVNRAQYWERCADYVEKEVTCDKCGALLSYDENEDVKEECIEKAFATNMPSGYGRKQKYIICPQCHNKIITWSTR